MQHISFLLVAVLATFAWPLKAQIHRCAEPDGRIEFSNLGCAKNSVVSMPKVRANVLDFSGMREQDLRDHDRLERERQQVVAAQGASGMNSGNEAACETASGIQNLETSASSITKGKKERTFLRDEARRARQCAAGQGSYSRDDLKRLREHAGAQSQVNAADRESARRQAEGIHSAADPTEGDRIAAARLAEEARADFRHAQAAAIAEAHRKAAAAQAATLTDRKVLRSCNGTRCVTNDGTRYSRNGLTGVLTDDSGRRCNPVPGTREFRCW